MHKHYMKKYRNGSYIEGCNLTHKIRKISDEENAAIKADIEQVEETRKRLQGKYANNE